MTDEIWAQFCQDPEWASEAERAAYLRGRSPATTKAEIVLRAKNLESEVSTLLEALETFYLNGTADEISGDVDSPVGHFYRVDRWIVTTDSQGFHSVWNYATIEAASSEFHRLDEDYSQWDSGA